MDSIVEIELEQADKIIRDLGLDTDAQYFFTDECAKRSDKYVPFDTGLLRDTKFITTDYYEYIQPYATRQYYENEGNGKEGTSRGGLRGKYWVERMWSAEEDEIIRAVQDYLDRRNT